MIKIEIKVQSDNKVIHKSVKKLLYVFLLKECEERYMNENKRKIHE